MTSDVICSVHLCMNQECNSFVLYHDRCYDRCYGGPACFDSRLKIRDHHRKSLASLASVELFCFSTLSKCGITQWVQVIVGPFCVEFACPRAKIGFLPLLRFLLPLKTCTIGQDEWESVCKCIYRSIDETSPWLTRERCVCMHEFSCLFINMHCPDQINC